MVKIVHEFKGKRIEKEVEIDNFLLSNNIGGYVSFSNKPVSKHQGLVLYDGLEHFELIDNLLIKKDLKKIINHFTHVEREYSDGIKDKIILPEGYNALIYELNKDQDINVMLDFRKVDDMRQFGRYYDIYEEDGDIIIHFIKKTDSREDATHDQEEYDIYLILRSHKEEHGACDYDKIGAWIKEDYSYDERRPYMPAPRYVYHALDIRCHKLICAFGTTKSAAKDELNKLVSHYDDLVKMNKRKKKLSGYFKRSWPSESDFARLAAVNSMLTLRNDAAYDGIYAGLYWFRQFWSRDELISLKAFIRMGDYAFVKQVLFRWLGMIQDDGRLPNRYPAADIASSDSIGWLFKRIDDFITALEKSRCLSHHLSFEDLVFMKNKAEKAAYSILEKYSDASLITDKGNETWMDTSVQAGVPRDGTILEVQALQLALYKTMKRLCKITGDDIGVKLASTFERELRFEVRREFWTGFYLKDSPTSDIIRPNIFIVYYVYPGLLSKKEWTTCFDTVLPKLWLDWGGLSTIDKSHPIYQPRHLGEGSISYHQGDSWFWINNLAAYCLRQHANFRYRKYIDTIKNMSIFEILWNGMPGHHTEVSSAEKMESFGCFAQAWSAAMLLELLG